MKCKALGLTVLVAASTLLQGCFPLAVTGMGAAAIMASDRRTTGMYIEDESIEWKVIARMRGQYPGLHVNATSFNRRVLLTGEAPDPETRAKIEASVRGLENVREVTNEIQIAGVSSLASRGNDALVTSNVKARMVNNGRFSPNHVKVVTEQGVVFLMGIVTQPEGDAAVEIARNASGVGRVVKVFEYVAP